MLLSFIYTNILMLKELRSNGGGVCVCCLYKRLQVYLKPKTHLTSAKLFSTNVPLLYPMKT